MDKSDFANQSIKWSNDAIDNRKNIYSINQPNTARLARRSQSNVEIESFKHIRLDCLIKQ